MRNVWPAHVEGLLRFLSEPNEKSNEDLALAYFRKLYPHEFQRQAAATGTDGHVPGHFVLELKGRTADWFSGLCQGIAYKRELDFSTIVVAAKNFLAVWRFSDLPQELRNDILSAEGAPSSLGSRFARTYSGQKLSVLKTALWRGDRIFLDLFSSQRDVVLDELRAFEAILLKAKRERHSIRPNNFKTVLKKMVHYFDGSNPIKAVNAFYSMAYAWGENSVLQISERTPNQATLGGEIIQDLIPGKRLLFKEFVESYAIRPGPSESIDDFFSRYDEALDAVDPDFRRRHGIFFTDLDLSKLALWVVKQYLPDLGKNHIVIDPACGSGNLVTNWRSPLELRHKVVSEIAPDLLHVVERRMKGDRWHNGRFTVIPRTSEGRGLNFLDNDAASYLGELTKYLAEKGQRPDKPLAFLCNPPYRSDDDQAATGADYEIHQSIVELVGKDASSERYCCFLAQMNMICKEAANSGLPGDSVLLVFTKAAWLTDRTMFRQLRREILGQFEDCAGFIVNSKQFFDVRGKFPVAFTIWKYKGEGSQLDCERPIPVVDLTAVRKSELAGLPWDDLDLVDQRCRDIVEKSPRVVLGLPRRSMKDWVGQRMTDFKRSRRKREEGDPLSGGLPTGDPRRKNKKAYGEQTGTAIGFMDDLTPCRISKPSSPAPHFHLDPRFMRVRDSRCFSGHADHYSYTARTVQEAKKLVFWYALGRTFAEHGYPMWADASEVWAPGGGDEPERQVLAYALAITLAENECVETVFPANNPIAGAPEIWCTNPMAPNDPESFWNRHLEVLARSGRATTPNSLMDSVRKLYDVWASRFHSAAEIFAPSQKTYFINQGVLRRTAGIVQIRDFAIATSDSELLSGLQRVREHLKSTKHEFHQLLVRPDGLNYFGHTSPVQQASAQQLLSPGSETFHLVVDRRVALATAIVGSLIDDRHLGRTKLAKIFYLADVAENLKLKAQYYREAAGPLDSRALYNQKVGIEYQCSARGYFSSKAASRSVRYSRGPEMENGLREAQRLLGEKWDGVKRIIGICARLDTEQCEIVSTLYACWNDLVLEGKLVEDTDVIEEFRTNWHAKKRRFSNTRLTKALAWMRQQKLVPQGQGQRTLVKVVRDDADF